ncbi:unnamed protein product [marine sediment metagenome]|uniref:Uncharacterized protein n=1 Tax=marine sediment metagenome TaxID=412755 RepID=X1CF43_9ZZZZ
MNLKELKDEIEKNEIKGNYEKIVQILQNVFKEKNIDRDVKRFAEIQIKERLYNLAHDSFSDLEYEKALDFGLKGIEFNDYSLKLKKLISISEREILRKKHF